MGINTSTSTSSTPQPNVVKNYDITKHKEYPALVASIKSECKSADLLKKIDKLTNDITILQTNLQYFDVPSSPQYKELLYKYMEQNKGVMYPKTYPNNNSSIIISSPVTPILYDNNPINKNRNDYDITNWVQSTQSANKVKLDLLNKTDTYPYS